jgi:hypothetical protein
VVILHYRRQEVNVPTFSHAFYYQFVLAIVLAVYVGFFASASSALVRR